MTKPIPNKLSEQIDTGVRLAIREAIERHRRLGESITFSKDGKIVTLTADKIPPYKPDWKIPFRIALGKAAIAPSNLGWRVGKQKEIAQAKGEDDEILSKFAYKDLSIAGQTYQLQIIPEDEPNAYIFRLINNTPGGKVPGGLKLILSSQDEAGITDVANTATDALEIKVTLTAEEGIIWKTEPLPENYVEETLWFLLQI